MTDDQHRATGVVSLTRGAEEAGWAAGWAAAGTAAGDWADQG